ncbi:Uncharacterized protein Adt_11596 [Abeliophyllum distichum]|uniref:Reverse transcriptase/retrotransposon-derived protein RNase H-like domain-containing protein n=1 Tax=Abeliophyllum distichum TaxID=126358 RepID=A0ABD1UNA3_9LAMI
MVNQREIEANPEKIKALVEMQSPSFPKEVQGLTGRLAALNQFISKSTDRCQPFFKTIKGGKKFEWTEECKKAFQELKVLLGKALLLSKPRNGETLLIYLAVSEKAILQKLDTSRRLIKWLIELNQFDISYKPRPSVKGQALADFMVEFGHIPEGLLEGKPQEILLIENGYTDVLSKLASSKDSDLMRAIPVKKLSRPSTDEILVPDTMKISKSPKLMKKIIAYLTNRILPDDRQEVQKLRRRAMKFVLQDEILYKRGPLPTGRGGIKFAVVAVDYFTKWCEAEPLAKITEENSGSSFGRTLSAASGFPIP